VLKYLSQLKPAASVAAAGAPAAGAAWPRFLCFVHFADPDAAGHAHGSASAEYRAAAMDCDKALGGIVEWLKKEKLYDQTRVYVTADHGFDRNAASHNNAPHIFLATNDKAVTKGGTQADIPATILERFGVDLSTLKPPLIGKPLTAAVLPVPAGK
jgi:arylsulfatase A-like enzyme